MTSYEKVLEALGNGVVKRNESRAEAHCPAHKDHRASLSVAVGDKDGTAVLKCHAGCTVPAILAAVGLKMEDLFSGTKRTGRRRLGATYDYQDEDGNLLYQVVRYDPKDFKQRRPDGRGGWIWKMKGVRRVPYHLPELMKANKSASVLIVEGEKDVDRLAALGLLATCNPGGAGKWKNLDQETVRTAFRGRNAVIVPDDEEVGREHARDVARRLQPVAAGVRLLELPRRPGMPERGADISDWLDAGGTREELERLIAEARPRPDEEADEEEARILDCMPESIGRPLCLVGGRAYAASWVPIETGPERSATHEVKLVVVRDDGQLFTEAPLPSAQPLRKLGAKVNLPEQVDGWSGAGVRRFLDGDRPDPAEVFRKVRDVIDSFMDFNRSLASQEVMCELVASYVLATYYLDAFNVVGYLWPNGDKGSGKTSLLATVCAMAYLGEVILAGGTYATLRDLAGYGATLAFDDAEAVMDPKKSDPDKRALLLAGNRRGITISVKELEGKKWVTRRIHAFCPRLFSAIRLPDETLASRTILIPLIRSADKEKIDRDVLDHQVWPCDRRRLVDDLWALGLQNLPKLRQYDVEAARKSRLSGRNLEPWRGVLAVGLWLEKEHGVEGLSGRLSELSVRYQEERQDIETADLTRLIVQQLTSLARQTEGERMEFETRQVTTLVNEFARQNDLCQESDKFTSGVKVGRRLERLRLRRGERRNNRRSWIATRGEIEGLAVSYGLAPQSGTPGKPGNMAGGSAGLPGQPAQPDCEGGVDAPDDKPERAGENAAEPTGDLATLASCLGGTDRATTDASGTPPISPRSGGDDNEEVEVSL